MQFPSSGEELIPITRLAKQFGTDAGRVYAILSQKGIEPAVVVPFSRGFMRQYRPSDIADVPGLLKAIDDSRTEAKAARAQKFAEVRAKAYTPAARAKAKVTSALNRAKREKAELVELRKLAKIVKRLSA